MDLLDLEKTLGNFAMPAGLIWVLLLAGVLLLVRRRQWFPALMAALLWALYGLAANFYVGSALLATLERGVPHLEVKGLEPFDAVFVLGGGTDLDPSGEPILSEAGDRIVTAARLWHAGKARLLVASGAARDADGGVRDLGGETRALWLALGVPDSAILVVDEPCWITRDELRAYRRLQDRRHFRRMALVSSASHLPRAMALAAGVELDFTPVGADWKGRRHPLQLYRLVPRGEGLARTGVACWEYLGRWVGR